MRADATPAYRRIAPEYAGMCRFMIAGLIAHPGVGYHPIEGGPIGTIRKGTTW